MTQDSVNLTNDAEIVLVGFESKEGLQNSNLWVGDTGATCHMVCNDANLLDYKTVNDEVIVGDGRPLNVIKIGKIKVQFTNNSTKYSIIVLENVKYVPSLKMNLFSLVLGIKKGWKLESNGSTLTLSKHQNSIKFDKRIPMGGSFLLYAEELKKDHIYVLSPKKQMSLKAFHDRFGHASKKITKETAHRLGIKLIGQLKTCERLCVRED